MMVALARMETRKMPRYPKPASSLILSRRTKMPTLMAITPTKATIREINVAVG